MRQREKVAMPHLPTPSELVGERGKNVSHRLPNRWLIFVSSSHFLLENERRPLLGALSCG